MSEPEMVVNTITFDECEMVVDWAIDNGKCLHNGDTPERFWNKYKTGTCVVLRKYMISFCSRFFATMFIRVKIISMHTFHNRVINNNYMKRKYSLK